MMMAVPEHEKVSILLVDDHPENLLALEALLSNLGENLVRAESGIEALRLLLHHEFALILLDGDMTAINGFETAELIQQRGRKPLEAEGPKPPAYRMGENLARRTEWFRHPLGHYGKRHYRTQARGRA